MHSFTLREPALADQPRERLAANGTEVLSDQELLMILIGSGTKNSSTSEIARSIMEYFDNLYYLKKASLEELRSIKGIGSVKAIEIQAALELGKRAAYANLPKARRVVSSSDMGHYWIRRLKDEHQEKMIAVYLNTKNEVLKEQTIFIGSLNQAIAHPREIFRLAVKISAARLVIVHNHPSGDTAPSKNDLAFTKRMIESGEMLGIEILDHFIIGSEKYLSMRAAGYLFDEE